MLGTNIKGMQHTQFQELSSLFTRLGKGIHDEFGHQSVCGSSVLDKTLRIVGTEDTVNIKRIAALLMITSGAATQHVVALEALGLVQRSHGREDRREINVSLTKKGQQAYSKIQTVTLHILQSVFADFDETEITQFNRLLTKAAKKYEIKE